MVRVRFPLGILEVYMAMNRIAKAAKKVADSLAEFIEEHGEGYDKDEVSHLVNAHGVLTQTVANNGGPAWNGVDGCWER